MANNMHDGTPTPETRPAWHQYSFQSLLLAVAFVSVLCSCCICTHWLVASAVALPVLFGGVTGKMIAGSADGFVQGIVFGVVFLLGSVFICCPILFILFPQLVNAPWQCFGALHVVAVLIGGILAGRLERSRR